MNQEEVRRLRVELLGPEGAAAIEEEWRQRPGCQRLWLRLGYWKADCREKLSAWRWRIATNLKGFFGLLQDEGVEAGSWMLSSKDKERGPSRERLWLQLLAGRLFGRREDI
jgi:hypothetical protein